MVSRRARTRERWCDIAESRIIESGKDGRASRVSIRSATTVDVDSRRFSCVDNVGRERRRIRGLRDERDYAYDLAFDFVHLENTSRKYTAGSERRANYRTKPRAKQSV